MRWENKKLWIEVKKYEKWNRVQAPVKVNQLNDYWSSEDEIKSEVNESIARAVPHHLKQFQ
jgi:hypothetical protein